MEFQRVNRTDPERVFVVVKWSWSTAASSAGQWCSWDAITDKDGLGVSKPTGKNRNTVAGVMIDATANGDYGLCQVWGYRANARMSGGSGTAAAGSSLTGGTLLYSKTAGFCMYGQNLIASTVTIGSYRISHVGFSLGPANTAAKYTSATTWIGKAFITCL
jgi:hypothetical protein